MAQPTKYPLWDTNQTATSDPGSAREADGWQAPAGVPEKPPYQTFNHWMNNVYLWLKYFNEQGVADWDAAITYAIGAYVVATDKKLYRALVSQAGNTPVGDAVNWQPVGDFLNVLTSTDVTRGLTAAQGKVLKDIQDTILAGTSPQATETARGFNFLPKPIIASNGTDASHDLDTTAGNFAFDDGTGTAAIGAFTKQIDATWAAGTAAGGMNDAEVVGNNTTYYYFALSNADGSVVDFGFDTSSTAANLLADTAVIAAGLTKYSYELRVITDGSANILPFKQIGNIFTLDSMGADYSVALGSAPTARVTPALPSIPTGEGIRAIFNVVAAGSTSAPTSIYLIFSNPDQSDQVPSATAFSLAFVQHATEFEEESGQFQVFSNSSGQIGIRSNTIQTSINLVVVGWEDTLRR